MRTIGIGLFLVVLTGRALAAQAAPDSIKVRVDRVFADLDRTDTPGCSVGVDRAGTAVFRHGYGMASLEGRAPMTEYSVLESGSVAKQFTAGVIARLAQDGRLGLDDPVRKYIPELPDYGSPVTIRMLLHHTSGIRDMWTLFALAGQETGTVLFTMPQALRMVYRQRELNFPPNSRYLYSNSGFLLLAEIVARVSGKPLSAYAADLFFKPLGMDHTQWRDDWNRVVPGRATAYAPAPGGFRVDMPFMSVYGAGGLLTTVGDLLKWTANFDHPAIGGQAWVDTMQEQGRLSDGRSIDYALGLIVTRYHGEREVSHSGATGGYRTFLGRWPDRRVAVAVLCNVGNANPVALGHRVADIFLDLPAAPTAAAGKPEAAPSSGTGLVGRYRAPATEDILAIVARDGRLFMDLGPTLALVQDGPDRFRVPELEASLAVGRREGRVATVTMAAGSDTTVYEPIVTPPAPQRDLGRFPGAFRSDELDVTYRIAKLDSTLTVQIGEREPTVAIRTGPASFSIPGGASLRFTGTASVADGFLLFAGRVRNLRFVRQ